ncbi:MAG: hypothetical protein V3W37_08955 [Candidatus Binatia bacterium]
MTEIRLAVEILRYKKRVGTLTDDDKLLLSTIRDLCGLVIEGFEPPPRFNSSEVLVYKSDEDYWRRTGLDIRAIERYRSEGETSEDDDGKGSEDSGREVRRCTP